MPPTDVQRLRHMRDAAREALDLLGSATDDDIAKNRMLQLALVKLTEIIGEAAGGISADTRSRVPDIDWPRVVATRNRLIHGYYDIDAAIVGRTVREDFPPLIEAVERLLGAES